jgi:hypothetical protein
VATSAKIVALAVQATREQRRRADRILDRTALLPAKRAYDAHSAAAVLALGRQAKGMTRQTAGPAGIAGVARHAALYVARGLGLIAKDFAASARDSFTESLRGLASFMGVVRRGEPSPLDDVGRVRSIAALRTAELQRLRERSLTALGKDVGQNVQGALLALPAESTYGDAIGLVGEALDDEWWRVERLVRTEASYAFNVAQADGIVEVAGAVPGLMQRWTEMVDDLSGRPLDRRVAQDSIEMHGQITPPGGMFKMPEDAHVSIGLLRGAWYHPPNRPHDRAVLTPWQRGWGVPGWVLQGGRRIELA